jgi:hypothetical protein
MSRSTFSGPVQVGVDDSLAWNGTSVTTGPNWGFLKMAQSAPITQRSVTAYPTNTNATDMTMVIPGNSTITGISVLVTTAWTTTTTLDIGQAWGVGINDPDDLVNDLDMSALGLVVAGPGDTDNLAAGDINNWMNNSVRQSPTAPIDRCITCTSPGTGLGVGILTVEYCQAVNLEPIA